MEKENRFDKFKRWFLYYQNLFGLNGYRIDFKYTPIKDARADIDILQTDMVAKIRLDSKPDEKYDVKQTAKHEALHLLVGRLEKNGRTRYISDAEIYEATEELVRRLETLIK